MGLSCILKVRRVALVNFRFPTLLTRTTSTRRRQGLLGCAPNTGILVHRGRRWGSPWCPVCRFWTRARRVQVLTRLARRGYGHRHSLERRPGRAPSWSPRIAGKVSALLRSRQRRLERQGIPKRGIPRRCSTRIDVCSEITLRVNGEWIGETPSTVLTVQGIRRRIRI
jgi:hypothetical protein